MPTQAAKAAAMMLHFSSMKNYEQAATAFNALFASTNPIHEVLPDCRVWAPFDRMDDDDLWRSIENAASLIDAAAEHFGGRHESRL